MNPGYFAALFFLLSAGLGSCGQILKLWRRTQAWRRGELNRAEVAAGLLPFRELVAYIGFILFASSALTRSYIDFYLLMSRLPTVFLATVIMWFLRYHGVPKAQSYFRILIIGDLLLCVLLVLALYGVPLGGGILAKIIDSTLAFSALFLFYGKLSQAMSMLRSGAAGGVSWIREIGLVLKDSSGLWYSLLVGPELFWVSVMHVFSGLSGLTICAAKYVVERVKR